MTQLDSEATSEQTPRSSNPLPFVLPLILFLLIASRYPDVAPPSEFDQLHQLVPESEESGGMTPETWWYMVMIGVQVVVASGLLIWFRKVYFQHFPFRISPLSVVVGIVGVVLWIGVCYLELEPRLLLALGFDTSRPSFDPFTLKDSSVRTLFLALRFTLLALIVPIIEELFLRGWLVRWIENPSWEYVSLQGLSWKALLAASVYGVLTHPSEAIAAFLWFGLVTWLMNRTGSLWDCVVAHAVTNLLLGIYVVKFEQWQLW
jgi:CAAX prenyl protease-like protein